jgi:hypothetical protein
MKRTFVALGIAAAFAVSLFAIAQADMKGMKDTKGMKEKAKAGVEKTMTVTGELVDMGCYLGMGAKGAGHKECALKCAAMGMPMGLLTSKGTLYLLTVSHDDAAPFNQCKDWMADQVSITGPVMTRNGIKAIEVTAAKTAEAAAK